jgi:hypothetical protein
MPDRAADDRLRRPLRRRRSREWDRLIPRDLVIFFESVTVRFVFLPVGIPHATASRIHMTIPTSLTFFFGVYRQCRSGLRSNGQSCELYDGNQRARSGNDHSAREILVTSMRLHSPWQLPLFTSLLCLYGGSTTASELIATELFRDLTPSQRASSFNCSLFPIRLSLD